MIMPKGKPPEQAELEAAETETTEEAIPGAPDEWRRGNVHQRKLWVTDRLGRIQKEGRLKVSSSREVATVQHDDVVAAVKPLMVAAGLDVTLVPVEHTYELQEVRRADGRQATERFHLLKFEGHIVNVDKPEDRIPVTAYGTGLDSGDKGYGKGMSYGKKYALLNLFLAETGAGDEPEIGATPTNMEPQRASRTGGPASGGGGGNGRKKVELALNRSPINGLTDHIPDDAWGEIASDWHDGYRITDAQRRLLFARTKGAGYSKEEVAKILQHHLGVESTADLAADWKGKGKEPFQKLLDIFDAFPHQKEPEPGDLS